MNTYTKTETPASTPTPTPVPAKRPAFWFSRHEPTPAQLAEISTSGHTLTPDAIALGRQLGAREIDSLEDLEAILEALRDALIRFEAGAVYGVFPTPLLAAMCEAPGDVPCYAAWNVARTPEGGGKPTFTHFRWMQVGSL